MKKIKVAKYDLEGNFLEKQEADSYVELCLLNKLNPTNYTTGIKRAINNQNITSGKFQWKILRTDGSYPTNIGAVYTAIPKGNSNYKVSKYYNNRLISVYDSITEASLKNDIVDISGISRNFKKNKEYSWNGFVFKKIV